MHTGHTSVDPSQKCVEQMKPNTIEHVVPSMISKNRQNSLIVNASEFWLSWEGSLPGKGREGSSGAWGYNGHIRKNPSSCKNKIS